jgi:hypothetical protein
MLVITIEQCTDKAGAGMLRNKPRIQEFLGLQYSGFYGRTLKYASLLPGRCHVIEPFGAKCYLCSDAQTAKVL